MIYLIRGQRVMLDFDLARIMGVTTKRLKEQYRRNVEGFPNNFAFQLAIKNLQLESQFANLKLAWWPPVSSDSFHRTRRPHVGHILNSPIAVEAVSGWSRLPFLCANNYRK